MTDIDALDNLLADATLRPWAASRAAFALLWDSLNKARGFGWETNPWIWRIAFRKLP